MTPDELEFAGRELYGRQWRALLATALEISPRTLARRIEGIIPRETELAVYFLLACHRADIICKVNRPIISGGVKL